MSNDRPADLPANPELDESMNLLRMARSGDRDALGRLLDRYQERIYRIVRIRMGSALRRTMESADIVQGANLVALRKLADIEVNDHAAIIRWLSRVIENQLRDAAEHQMAEKRDPNREIAIDATGETDNAACRHVGEPPDRGPSPSEAISHSELQEIYDACVRDLELDHREVILLREFHGGSWDFVRESLGRVSVHATQELYHRAQVKLARLLRLRLGGDGTASH